MVCKGVVSIAVCVAICRPFFAFVVTLIIQSGRVAQMVERSLMDIHIPHASPMMMMALVITRKLSFEQCVFCSVSIQTTVHELSPCL